MKKSRIIHAVFPLLVYLVTSLSSQAATGGLANPDYSGCVSTPLPTAPTGPSVEKTWNFSISNVDFGKLNVMAWRIPCGDTNSAVVLRLTAEKPTTTFGNLPIVACGSPFFTVVQDGIQYNSVVLVQEPGGGAFCNELLIPQTFLLEQAPKSESSNFDDDVAFSLYYDVGTGVGLPLEIPAHVSSSAPVNLGGTIKTADGTDVCAMALASGKFMFSCSPKGMLSLTDLPREKDSTVKRQIYADGFFPKIDTLTGSSNDAVVMTRSGTCPNYNTPYDAGVFPDSAGKRINISGKVLTQNSQTPICAMVLANGKHTFSCDGSGSYNLNIPLDNNGQYKLQVYADGSAPTIQTFDEFRAANDVRMARAAECQ